MSGHSKWANIKHRKEKADAERGRIFTKVAREITVAAREGGGDPSSNFRLRMAIEKAKSVNMPQENIQRAIKRGTGELTSEALESVVYEGYGPGGIAIMLDILTDNRNRTASDIRHLFTKYGGNLGESGCVAWMFSQKGLLLVDRSVEPGSRLSEDELLLWALEAGAEDVEVTPDSFEIVTDSAAFSAVKEALEKKGVKFAAAEITMLPHSTVPVAEKDVSSVMKLLNALEEHDDVQNVYTNAELPSGLSS
ncbi:MAG: YebC/PmpR family DNA-binding transcriptional regulator [Bacillota bacterium]|nr:YebC/PmpR family DNA-binding transcriptional regulator [Bacillota bacterium]